MFIRKKENKSKSVSVQVIQKIRGKYKVIKTIGCATAQHEISNLIVIAKQEIERLTAQPKLFVSEKDIAIEEAFASLENASIQTVGPELIFGKIYDHIGFDAIPEKLFRHLVIARLAFPLSKLKTVEYLERYQGITVSIDSVYRFLDKLTAHYKSQVEQITYAHTKNILGDNVSVVFYDMTTLYFEASDEDDLRKTGFSKDGKHQCPQIFLGLLVGLGGYAIGYDIFEGDTYEGHALIPFLKQISNKFNLDKPIVVADAGLLSNKNISALEKKEYQYILGARIKNETGSIMSQILSSKFQDESTLEISKGNGKRLIISYSEKRAKKDAYNRSRGLGRLEKQISKGRLTKANINNRGYNKYLKLAGEIDISIDYDKYDNDSKWDGLKGYITNTSLSTSEVIDNYKNLWHIEKAFRMSKTDLRIRPIYHRIKKRIEAHICISFTAYAIYKELERVLYENKSSLTVVRAAELPQNMYQITYMLPDSKHSKHQLLKMDEKQAELYNLIQKIY